MSIVDKSLHFGQQNFFFCNSYIGSTETGDDYEYVVYMDKKGLILIAQYNADGDHARFCVKKIGTETGEDYDSLVEARGTYKYVLPSKLIDLTI